MKQRKNYKSRFPVGAGNDVGEVESFSCFFKFCRNNQQDCTSFPRKWESAVTYVLVLDYYEDLALSKISL
jgi:hypothetical protein